MKKVFAGLMLLMLSACMSSAAAKWETMNFTDDIAQDFQNLTEYCLKHEVAVKDIFWANHIESSDLKAGSTIYLPARQADLLAIWQHIGAWEPKALVPVTSAAAAKRLIEPEQKAQPAQKKADVNVQPKPETTIAQTTKPAEKTAEPSPAEVTAQTAKPEPLKQAEKADAPKTKRTAKTKRADPAEVIAQTAKPDKILTAKRKTPQDEIPGLMDPIIILSPNGDPTNGPMRLMISGDKVEVVKLPQDALPKKPAVTDIYEPFASSYSYLPYYNLTNRQRNNNIYTNLNSLNGKMMWPVDGKISSPFGKWRGKHKHEGIDIPMPAGTPIRAARNGVVARTGNNSTVGFRGYGNFVMLDHGGSIKTLYAHCSKVAVVPGQRIMQGQIIAYVGSTGRSTANHLHFEVRVNDTKVNPVPYMAGSTHLASHK